ncbi:hypothetical protein B484DRAFT_320227, partial [Ochromonadaceae sp. CCMP2298]
IEINPSVVRFTHSRVRPYFTGCGKRIEETIAEIVEGLITISDLPLITVIESDGQLYSLNNRRLYVIKHIQNLGLISTVEVFVKPALEREQKKYVPERCSLQCRVMKEHVGVEGEEEVGEVEGGEGGEGVQDEGTGG